MFDVITHAKPGRATLLTTHVMEDADALADRIGIMVSGRLACLGSAAHLKFAYGRGYQVEVHSARADADAIEPDIRALVARAASAVALVEANCGHFRYEAEDVALARVFEALLGSRERLGIVDFSVSETTLEQVFLSIGRQRRAQMTALTEAGT